MNFKNISASIRSLPSRLSSASAAFRAPIAVRPPDLTGDRVIAANAANLVAVRDKVIQVLNGQIPDPVVAELFITNFCDFACPHCRCAQYHGDSSQFLNFGTMDNLLRELAERSVMKIELGGGGEPLQHPQIAEVFDRFAEYGLGVGMITNGYRFTQEPELAESFMGFGDWVRFSLDGVSDDVFRAVHGRRDISYGALKEVISNMASASRAKEGVDQRPKIGMKLIIEEPNKGQILDSVDEALEMGVHYLQFKFLEGHPWTLTEGRDELVRAIQARAAEIPAKDLYIDILPGYGGPRKIERCVMSILHPLIDWDGTIYMCAFFSHRKETHSIGNIEDGGFFTHWGSELHRQRIKEVDPMQCVPNCPMLRYNPVMKFIEDENFRMEYI